MVRLHAETVEKPVGEPVLQPLDVSVKRLADNSIEFDMVGVDPAIANSVRRTMHADIPTLAIETVLVANNTSVIPDEVFAHRLGLVPLWYRDLLQPGCPAVTAANPIVLTLRVRNASKQPISVYSRELQVRDAEWRDAVRVIDGDIQLLRLAANQEVDMELHAIEGTGREHAKWSPVAAAAYRLLPQITLLQPITGPDATKFAKCFTAGVVAVEGGKAVVRNPRLDSVSRECLRHPEFEGKVELSRVDDHFIFSIEAIGQLSPVRVVESSFDILISKCDALLSNLQ